MDNFDEFWHNKDMSSVRRWMRHWWAPRTSNPYHSSNIIDLTPNPVRTIKMWFKNDGSLFSEVSCFIF